VEERVARLEADVAHIRSDIGEMKVDIREMRRSIGSLREADTSIRAAMQRGFSSQVEALAALRLEMTKSNFATRIWMLSLAGILLSVLARGFHWI
jgi:hypothetical protein